MGRAVGFAAGRAVGLGYECGLEWPLVHGGNGGCCGARQAGGLPGAWGKAPPLQPPGANAVDAQVPAAQQGWAQPGLGARSSTWRLCCRLAWAAPTLIIK